MIVRRAVALAALLGAVAVRAADAPKPAPRGPAIYFSAAPWDGAAYALHIPLPKGDGAPDPVINVDLWGNPEFKTTKTILLTGREDASGGPKTGIGRASYQAKAGNSWPQELAGTLVFTRLEKGKPVTGTYDFTTAKGLRLKGAFRAAWGNDRFSMRGG